MTWFGLILWHVFGVHHVYISTGPVQALRRVRRAPNGRPYAKFNDVVIFLDLADLPECVTPLTWGGGPLARK